MVNTISNAIESMGYNYHVLIEIPDQTVLRLGIELENAKTDCIIDIREPDKLVAVFIICPVSVPEEGRKRIAEFIAMANFGLLLGGFEMDMGDGELRYKSSFIFDDNDENQETIFKQHLFTALQVMDKFFPGIMSVLFANLDPRTAISQINQAIDPKMN